MLSVLLSLWILPSIGADVEATKRTSALGWSTVADGVRDFGEGMRNARARHSAKPKHVFLRTCAAHADSESYDSRPPDPES
jgi:hypothetical protein